MATKSSKGATPPRKPARPASRRPARNAAQSETERIVVLLRHGIAEDRAPEGADADRALTPEGHAEMKQIGRGLERALPKVQAIYTSPLIRATQTALWVSKAYRSRVTLTTVDALAPPASPEDLLALIASAAERRIVIVGHEPTLTGTLRQLLGVIDPRLVRLEPGGCYALRMAPDGSAVVEWILPPRVLRKLGE